MGQLAYWMVEMDGYAIGDHAEADPHGAVVDSGTSFIIMPSDVWAVFQQQMPSQQMCSGAGMPNIVIPLGGVQYILEPSEACLCQYPRPSPPLLMPLSLERWRFSTLASSSLWLSIGTCS